MQVATILPTHYLNLIDGKPYQMALAHLVGKDKKYTEFYRLQSTEGPYIILDNGVIETGVPMSIGQLLNKAAMIGAHEIILPDVLQDSQQTLDLACASIEAMQSTGIHRQKYNIMVVPQGKTLDEWIECAELMLTMDIDTIGVPKVLTKIGGRDGRLEVLTRLGKKLRGVNVHLLGCWETPIECAMIRKAEQQGLIVPVRGVDSAIAYVYAREGILISQGPRPSGEIDFNAKNADIEMLKLNIDIWEEACMGPSNSNVHKLY